MLSIAGGVIQPSAFGTSDFAGRYRKRSSAGGNGSGRMRAAWSYFASFPKNATDFAELARTMLRMPVLANGGEKATGAVLTSQMPLVASSSRVVIIRNSGH